MATNTENSTKETLITRLFGAGAHFGFSKSRRHPTAKPYLFGSAQGTDIFDLEKTSALLLEASAYLRELGTAGKQVLFVGTKEEAKSLVEQAALALDMPYVTNRWIGGMLTNTSEIQKRMNRLATLTTQGTTGELERKYTKKERLLISREMEKLAFNFGGIRSMERLPAALVVVDPRHDSIAVAEAHAMHIPVVAIMSSDCDATNIAKPVFVNDAHRASVALALDELVAAYRSGRSEYTPPPAPERTRTRTAARG